MAHSSYRNGAGLRIDRRPGASTGLLLTLSAVLLVQLFVGVESLALATEGEADATASPIRAAVASATQTAPPEADWSGPVLYRQPDSKPYHLILVEKELQKLRLYRFDGTYRLLESYDCSTGEKHGKKREEGDERTPEGIFFNDRTFRDRQVTVFGDRAFGLTYPDPLDMIAGNRGSGIFMHGTNRPLLPYSSNGCVVLENGDLAHLDGIVDIGETPVIIGKRLPFHSRAMTGALDELIPFFKRAMLPEDYAGLQADYQDFTVLGFEDRVVVSAAVSVHSGDNVSGISRLYLARPGESLLVLVKREWYPK